MISIDFAPRCFFQCKYLFHCISLYVIAVDFIWVENFRANVRSKAFFCCRKIIKVERKFLVFTKIVAVLFVVKIFGIPCARNGVCIKFKRGLEWLSICSKISILPDTKRQLKGQETTLNKKKKEDKYHWIEVIFICIEMHVKCRIKV